MRRLRSTIPGARLLELPGDEHFFWVAPFGEMLEAIGSFVAELGGQEASLERFLATVMFTDIVASTETAGRLGDRAWRDLLQRHHERVRGQLARFRGREISTAGDGFFATFDGPARGIRCAQAIVQSVRELGIEVRAGLHTGEVEMIDGEIGGIAVNIGARVGAKADASQVLVSQTVKDLVAGSGLAFEDSGEHALKGVPGRWRLYRVTT
jgi:class 3 adenylate cyclase